MKFMGMMLLLLLSSFVAVSADKEPAKPAAPVIPGSEVLLFNINQSADGWPTLGPGKNISNQPGYDSQPRFSNDGNILYYTHAVLEGSSMQMDILQYDLKTQITTPYLVTAESEYSPTPQLQGAGLSVVQVDQHGDQYLVLLNNQAAPEQQSQRYSDLKQVGYFNWTNGGDLWTFVLNDENGGDLYHQGVDLVAEKITTNIGRSFITDADGKVLYFVDKKTQPWSINAITAAAKLPKTVMSLPLGVEDFTLDSQGRFWAGRNNTLYVSTDQQRWYIAHEFNDPSLHQITRVTTNPAANKIAIVFAEKNHNE